MNCIKKCLSAALLFFLVTAVCFTCTQCSKNYSIFYQEEKIKTTTPPYKTEFGEIMLPLRATMAIFDGEVMQKENQIRITQNTREIILHLESDTAYANRREIHLTAPVTQLEDEIFFPASALTAFIGAAAVINEDEKNIQLIPPAFRDMMNDTIVSDTNRKEGEIKTYNGISIIDGMGMEFLHFSNDQAVKYADIVNTYCDKLPDVNVYSMIVPTAAEFYGPKNRYPDYTSGIRTAYQSLEPGVTPVNVIKELDAHADEKLYFNTDHHWTQRGAYYAYKAFADLKKLPLDPIDSFPNDHFDGYLGSFINYTRGTEGETILRNHADLLERFLPKVEVSGKAYYDMNMEKYIMDIPVVDTKSTTYACFIDGDFPITVFKTSVENGKKLVLIKESYGNAFATWAVNNYSEVYVVDSRQFNDSLHTNASEPFDMIEFYNKIRFDDLLILSYPVSVAESSMRQALLSFVK